MKKRTIYLMGLVTLLVFPIPAFLVLYFFSDFSISQFFDLNNIHFGSIFIGILVGVLYAGLAALVMRAPIFKTIPLRVDELVSSMNLTYLDAIFLSICAGVGEELLFRVGVQFYLGPIITSIVFVAVHGYLNPFDWKTSLYGLVVLPLSFILGYTYEFVGLWPAVAIHFAYDAVLFIYFIHSDRKEKQEKAIERQKLMNTWMLEEKRKQNESENESENENENESESDSIADFDSDKSAFGEED